MYFYRAWDYLVNMAHRWPSISTEIQKHPKFSYHYILYVFHLLKVSKTLNIDEYLSDFKSFNFK